MKKQKNLTVAETMLLMQAVEGKSRLVQRGLIVVTDEGRRYIAEEKRRSDYYLNLREKEPASGRVQ